MGKRPRQAEAQEPRLSVALRWTTSARADLVRLHEFLEPVNPQAAALAVRQLVAGARRIPGHPRLGPRLREFAPREAMGKWMGLLKPSLVVLALIIVAHVGFTLVDN